MNLLKILKYIKNNIKIIILINLIKFNHKYYNNIKIYKILIIILLNV